MNCPECGALDFACGARYHEFLVLEFSDPGYATVHHLTVTAYMLQHSSKLTRESWLHMRELMREFLVENKPPAFIRKQNKKFIDSGERKFKISSKDGKPVINQIPWRKTILDVRADNSKIYCEDITTWSGTVLKDAENIPIG